MTAKLIDSLARLTLPEFGSYVATISEELVECGSLAIAWKLSAPRLGSLGFATGQSQQVEMGLSESELTQNSSKRVDLRLSDAGVPLILLRVT